MPTRKVSERERLMTYARSASDDDLEQAFEILSVERRIRTGGKKAGQQTTKRSTKKPASTPPPPTSDTQQE